MSKPTAIPGLEGYYATKQGEILSKRIRKWMGYGKGTKSAIGKKFVLLKPNSSGRYLTVSICRNGKRTTMYVHLLVLRTFQGERPEGLVACHNNGDNFDNRNRNLRWDTHKSNCKDKIRHGTNVAAKGELHGNSKLTEEQARDIKFSKTSPSLLAEKYGVKVAAIHKIRKGLRWGHIK